MVQTKLLIIDNIPYMTIILAGDDDIAHFHTALEVAKRECMVPSNSVFCETILQQMTEQTKGLENATG